MLLMYFMDGENVDKVSSVARSRSGCFPIVSQVESSHKKPTQETFACRALWHSPVTSIVATQMCYFGHRAILMGEVSLKKSRFV